MITQIKNGTVIDPAEGVHEIRDVWLRDGRIAAGGGVPDRIVDASGLTVCPGLIDIHMHEDPVGPDGHIEAYGEDSVFACMLHMGVTTAVAGNCGENKFHPADYLDLADADGLPVNVAMLAGHGYFRCAAGCGDPYGPASPAQQAVMAAEIEQALERGCAGVSFGIRYVPGMDADELVTAAGACRRTGKPVAAHIRDDAAAVFGAAREFLDAGARLGVPLQISHIGSMAGFGQMEAFLALTDEYRRRLPRLGCDCYPYDAFSTPLGSATYDEGWLERYGCDYGALELCEGEYRGRPCTEAIFRAERAAHPETMTVCRVMRGSDVDLAFRHADVMVASDATLHRGQGHPRACGTFPRVLSRYVKNGTLTLEDAIRRMTVLPARQMGFKTKGSLREGMDADVLIFDPETVADRASFAAPLTPPEGIEWVFVNGRPALEKGVILERRAGRSVRT